MHGSTYTFLARIVAQQWPYTVFTKAEITGLWVDNNPLCFPWGSFPENVRKSYTTGCLWRTYQDYCLELMLLAPSHLLKHQIMLMSQHQTCFFVKLHFPAKLVLAKCWLIPGLVLPASYFGSQDPQSNISKFPGFCNTLSAWDFCSSSSFCMLFL